MTRDELIERIVDMSLIVNGHDPKGFRKFASYEIPEGQVAKAELELEEKRAERILRSFTPEEYLSAVRPGWRMVNPEEVHAIKRKQREIREKFYSTFSDSPKEPSDG